MIDTYPDLRKFFRDPARWAAFTDAVWAIRNPLPGAWSGFEDEDVLWESHHGKRWPVSPVPVLSFAFSSPEDPRLAGGGLHDVVVDGESFRVGIFDGVHTDFSSVTYANILLPGNAQVSVPAIDWVEEQDDEPERFPEPFMRPVRFDPRP